MLHIKSFALRYFQKLCIYFLKVPNFLEIFKMVYFYFEHDCIFLSTAYIFFHSSRKVTFKVEVLLLLRFSYYDDRWVLFFSQSFLSNFWTKRPWTKIFGRNFAEWCKCKRYLITCVHLPNYPYNNLYYTALMIFLPYFLTKFSRQLKRNYSVWF